MNNKKISSNKKRNLVNLVNSSNNQFNDNFKFNFKQNFGVYFIVLNVLIVLFLSVLLINNNYNYFNSYFKNLDVNNFNLLTGNVPREITQTDVGLNDEQVNKINSYDSLISKYCQIESADNVVECIYVTKAVMTQESQGISNAISHTGCAGLMQFCSGTAKDDRFKDIFQRITPCCNGAESSCRVNALCNIANDDRFDSEKSIRAGVRYLMGFYNSYRGNIYLIALSYNAGSGISQSVLKKIAESKTNPELNFETIMRYGTDVIKTTYKESGDAKVSEVRTYLDKVSKYYGFWSKKSSGGLPSYNDLIYNFGKYKISPSFSVNINYDISEYSKIMSEAKILVEECTGKQNLKECISNKISTFGKTTVFQPDFKKEITESKYEWKLGNCNSLTDKFEQVVEDFYSCLTSNIKNSCSCSFALDSLPSNIKISIKKRIEYGVNVVDFILKDGSIILDTKTLNMKNICYFKELSGFRNLFGASDKYSTTDSELEISQSGNNLKISQGAWSRELSNILYKNIDGDVCFIPKESIANPESALTDLGMCMQNKQLYRFCVESKQELFSKTTEDYAQAVLSKLSGCSGEASCRAAAQNSLEYIKSVSDGKVFVSYLEPVQYKFAIHFRDDPPKILQNVLFFDAPKNKNSVLVAFSKSEADDVSGYNFYYQDLTKLEQLREDYVELGADTSVLKNLEQMSTQEMRDDKSTISWNSFSVSSAIVKEYLPADFNCEFDYDKKVCKYKTTIGGRSELIEHNFENSKAYFFDSSNYYVFILPLELNKKYKIGVTAFDVNGNELTNLAEEKIFISELSESVIKDDVRFDKLNSDYISAYGNLLSWVPPTNYENGEFVTNELPEYYSVFFYEALIDIYGVKYCDKNGFNEMKLYQSNIKENTFSLSLLPTMDSAKSYCFGVIAERGNVRILSNENDWKSAVNLVSFSSQPIILNK